MTPALALAHAPRAYAHARARARPRRQTDAHSSTHTHKHARRLRANGLFKSKAFGDLCSAVGSEWATAQSPEAVKTLLPSLAPKLAVIFTAAPLPPLSPSQVDRLGEVRK